MSPLSRRTFLVGAAAGAAANLVRGIPTVALPLAFEAGPPSLFTEGVASGDPSTDGFILWTRLDPEVFHGRQVLWEVFPTEDPGVVVASGVASVEGDRDGTIHVPVGNLAPATSFGYRFTAEPAGRGRDRRRRQRFGGDQIQGVTRTLPRDPTHLRIGVVSCGKYSDGYFHAYRELADMDCDLVLHLGDYIYASASFGGSDPLPLDRWGTIRSRLDDPNVEVGDLAGFRARYRQSRRDPDLQHLHGRVPVVAVWDDNDIANNAYRDGTQADPDGEHWPPRKRDGQQAWSEYLPTRLGEPDSNGNLSIWREIRAGKLLQLLMLDTRLQRDQQVSNAAAGSTAANDDPNRTMLGVAQRQWLEGRLRKRRDDVAWRVLGQGVVMAHWRVVGPPEDIGRVRHDIPLVADSAASQRLADGGVYWNSDGWDGYAHERARLLRKFSETGPVIVLSGDVHSSWANELVPDANALNDPVGVEFVVPAASSRPFASNVQGLTPPFEAAFTAANPWIKFCDLDANGFLVVDLEEERAIARWFEVDARAPDARGVRLLTTWQTDRGRRLLPHLT